MDDRRAGGVLRAVRRRRGWRQVDLARAAGVAQSTISLIERGHLDDLKFRTIREVFAALDVRFEPDARWRGGSLDRLLDQRHAALVELVVAMLRAAGWEVAVEVTFARFGERGSIDVFAAWRDGRVVLVVEVKSELTSIEETGRKLDVKARLAPEIALERFGWRPSTVGRLLVVPNLSTARRRVRDHAAYLDAMLPDRGVAVRRWLRHPAGPVAGLLFVSNIAGGDGKCRNASRIAGRGGPDRVRRACPRTSRASGAGSAGTRQAPATPKIAGDDI